MQTQVRAASRKAIAPRFQGSAIKRVLVPIDFSRISLKAIPYALAISRRFGADVHLLHVVDTTQFLSPALLSLAASARADWNQQLMVRLQRLASRYKDDGTVHVLQPSEGRAYNEICTVAQELNADLIVVATHGYTGYRRAFLGSTAERVVQHSPCPVLIVRPDAHDRAGFNGRRSPTDFRPARILVPTDFSECAKRGFRYAVKLAREFKAELRLVHVINPHAYPFGDEYAALDAAQLISQASHIARKRMRDMGAKTKARYSVKIEHGSPARKICEAANQDTDLIVISTHGRTGLRHALIGSTAERVVRYARCPVLILPTRFKSRFSKD